LFGVKSVWLKLVGSGWCKGGVRASCEKAAWCRRVQKNAFGVKLDVTVALCESSRVWKLACVKTGAQIV